MTPHNAAAGISQRWAGRGDILVGAVLLATGAALYFFAIPQWIDAAPGARNAAMSPRFMPNILALAIMLLGALIALFAALAPAAPGTAAPGSALRGLAITMAAIALYFLLIDIVGALVVAILITSGLQLLSGERRWAVLAAGGLAAPIVAILLLERVANVPLPGGLIGF